MPGLPLVSPPSKTNLKFRNPLRKISSCDAKAEQLRAARHVYRNRPDNPKPKVQMEVLYRSMGSSRRTQPVGKLKDTFTSCDLTQSTSVALVVHAIIGS